MTDYRQAQTLMLYDLIEKSNPGFKVSYPVGSVVFGVPADLAINPNDPYKNDTTVRVTPAPNTTGIGVVSVNYRRVNLATLFRGVTPKLTDWYISTSMPATVWIPLFVAKYGLSLTAADVAGLGGITSTGSVNVVTKPECLCYKGTVNLAWTRGVRPMADIFTDANRALTGRLYPGGNDFTTPGRKPQGEFLAFCQDASSIGSILEGVSLTGQSYAPTDPMVIALVDFLLANTSRTDWAARSAATGSGGISNLSWFRYVLPNAAIPEANSAKYNRCIVITSQAASWFSGKIIIHYKV